MEKLYIDRTQTHGCISVFIKDVEIIGAGTTIYSMPVSDRNSEYQRFADEYGIHFIFDDQIPEVDFYTVPHVDIMAADSSGGYIGTIGQTCSLETDAPICYIDHSRNCYLIALNGRDFLKKAFEWKKWLKPYDGVTCYHSKAEAQRELTFIDICEIEEKCPEEEVPNE